MTGPRTLEVRVPTNRYDRRGRPTHMDGWNEIIDAYKSNKYKGAAREAENVQHVAFYVARAMRKQGWSRMEDKKHAKPCIVTIIFVERDRRRDIGNVHGAAKYALDALTHRHSCGASAIYDDSQRWLKNISYEVAVDADEPGMRIALRAEAAVPQSIGVTHET